MSKPHVGIPTYLEGFRFRSRTEARWAAFFTRAGLQWEYEPYDLEGWIPDFVLVGEAPILVEVKAAVRIEDLEKEKAKIETGATAAGRDDALLLVGASPVLFVETGGYATFANQDGRSAHAGLNAQFCGDLLDDGETKYAWDEPPTSGGSLWVDCPKHGLGIFHLLMGWTVYPCGCGGKMYHYPADVDALQKMWAAACNDVQWMPIGVGR